jgi:hypothetical protein
MLSDKETRGIGLLLVLLAAAWISPAHGEVFLDQYQAVKEATWFKQYVDGVGTGFSWANTDLRMRKETPLYCQPAHLAMYPENYLNILNNYISRRGNSLSENSIVELLLLNALKEAFPCG